MFFAAGSGRACCGFGPLGGPRAARWFAARDPGQVDQKPDREDASLAFRNWCRPYSDEVEPLRKEEEERAQMGEKRAQLEAVLARGGPGSARDERVREEVEERRAARALAMRRAEVAARARGVAVRECTRERSGDSVRVLNLRCARTLATSPFARFLP